MGGKKDEWPIYRYYSVFSQNSGYFDQNEKGFKKCPFPHSLRFCHNWWASGGVPGVRYAEELSALFYLHWESLWPGVSNYLLVTFVRMVKGEYWYQMILVSRFSQSVQGTNLLFAQPKNF